MQNLVSLWNLSLSAIGTRSRIADEQEDSYEAETLRQWYEPVRDIILSAAFWHSCRAVKALTLKAERDFNLAWQPSDPEPPWAYAYKTPNDFLHPVHLDTFAPFQPSHMDNHSVLLSNATSPVLTYIKRQSNVGAWEPSLYMAIAYGLAAACAEKLHGKANRAMAAQQKANDFILDARVQAANMQTVEYDHVPDFLAARGVSTIVSATRYIYPVGPLLSVAVAS